MFFIGRNTSSPPQFPASELCLTHNDNFNNSTLDKEYSYQVRTIILSALNALKLLTDISQHIYVIRGYLLFFPL